MTYKAIDVLKFFMALCVVTIHCSTVEIIPIEPIRRLGIAIIRSAVPFFFATSAFLLYRHLEFDDHGKVKNKGAFIQRQWRYLQHILGLYVTWLTLYFCMTHNDTFHLGITEIVKAYTNEFFLWGSGYLWYLWGLLLVVPIITKLLTRRNRAWLLVVVGFALMCIFRLYSHFGSVSNPTWWQRPLCFVWQEHIVNVYGFCYAWAYISVGAFMATTSQWKCLKTKYMYIMLVAGLLYACVDLGEVCIGLQPVAFATVALCMRWDIKQESSWFKRLRELSTYIYLGHVFIVEFSHAIGFNDVNVQQWIFSLAGSIILASLVIWTKKIS